MAQKRRGRQTVLDMVRTLAIVFALVLPLWYFGQGHPGDRKRIRPVDPTVAYQDFRAATHGPVVSATPRGWTCTVRTYDKQVVRVGYVVDDHYLEFSGAPGTAFLDDATGKAVPHGTVRVGAVTWQDYLAPGGQESLVRSVDGVTVLVGGVRETATRAELEQLAAAVR